MKVIYDSMFPGRTKARSSDSRGTCASLVGDTDNTKEKRLNFPFSVKLNVNTLIITKTHKS